MSDISNESGKVIEKVQEILNSSEQNEEKLMQIRELVLESQDDLDVILKESIKRVHREIGNDSSAHFDLGIAYKEMGLLDEAIKSFQTAVTAGASPAQCLHMISLCLQDEGKFAEAEKVLREALAYKNLLAHETAILNKELGVVLNKLGNKKGALQCLEIAREITQNRMQNSSLKDRNQEFYLNVILSLIAKIKWESMSPWRKKIYTVLDRLFGKKEELIDPRTWS